MRDAGHLGTGLSGLAGIAVLAANKRGVIGKRSQKDHTAMLQPGHRYSYDLRVTLGERAGQFELATKS